MIMIIIIIKKIFKIKIDQNYKMKNAIMKNMWKKMKNLFKNKILMIMKVLINLL